MNSNQLQQSEMSQLQSNWSFSSAERLIPGTTMKMKSANATTMSNESYVTTTPVVQSEETFPPLEANYTWPVPSGAAQASVTLKQTEEYKKSNGTVEVNQEMAAIVDSSIIAEECDTEIVNEQSTPTAPVIEPQVELSSPQQIFDAKQIESATHLPKNASPDGETLKDSNAIQPILIEVPGTTLSEHDYCRSPKDDGKNSAIEHRTVPPVGSVITIPMNDTATVHNAVLLSGTKSLIDSSKKANERPNKIIVHSNELINFPVTVLGSRTLPNGVGQIKARPVILNPGAKVVPLKFASQPVFKRTFATMKTGNSQRPISSTGDSNSTNVTTLKRKIHENIPPVIPSKVQRVEKRVIGSSVASMEREGNSRPIPTVEYSTNVTTLKRKIHENIPPTIPSKVQRVEKRVIGSSVASMEREGNSRPIPTVEYSNSTSTVATTLKRNVQQNNPPIISSKGQRMAKPFPGEGSSKPSVRRGENLNSAAVSSNRGVKKSTSTVDLTSSTGQQSKDRSYLDCLKLLKQNNVAIFKVPKESSNNTLDKYKNFFDKNNISVAPVARISKNN